MYDTEFAEVYDSIYRTHRDYAAQAERTRAIALTNAPAATSLLDVGCGTGEDLRHLRRHFDVVGIDLAAPMVDIARTKLPDLPFHVGDMREFSLGRRFDVVTCIYSPVGYLPSREALADGVRNMVAHLAPGGVLLVEPFIFRENWDGGHLVHETYELDGRQVLRMGKWTTAGDRVAVEMNYLVGDDDGVRHFVDRQVLTLFSQAEYENAFVAAGCAVEFLSDGFADRGLFVARTVA
jgi:SAM-dependent methyltransferase